MSFKLSEVPENMQDILTSSADIVNEEFDYSKFMQAFAPTTNKNPPTLSPQVGPSIRNLNTLGTEPLRSCPPLRQPAFTFDEPSVLPKTSSTSNQFMPQPSTNDKLRNVLNEDNIRKAITDMVNKNGVNINSPILKLHITGNPNYDLDVNDILNIFSRFGKVVGIEISRHRTAFVIFDDIISALFAQKSLNNQYVKNLDIKLFVSWSNGTDDEQQPLKPDEGIRTPTNLSTQPLLNEFPAFNRSVSMSLPNLDAALPSFPYNPSKFTCKYEIQIENDKDFKIARKIIGPKGCNMKKILEICQQRHKRSDMNLQGDFLKLRLRGRGSGFKEGPEQKESDDPLHLCVSSKYGEVYQLACKLVEDLIGGLYKEYEVFCQKSGRPLSEPVQMKRIEIYNGTTEKKLVEDKMPTLKPRQSSTTVLPQKTLMYSKSLVLDRTFNSGPESSNNSISTLSDREVNNSPNKQGLRPSIEDTDLKSSP